jgi:hypothetical protein
VPFASGGLELKNLALVRVKIIAPIRELSATVELDRTFGPFHRANAAAVLRGVFHDVDSVANFVGDSSLARWH